MADVNLSAELREDFGKGFARRTRVAKRVPSVIYSKGQVPTHITVDAHDAEIGLKKSNALFEIDINGDKKLAIAKDVQKHVFKPVLYHIDFQEIVKGEKILVELPVKLIGEPAPHTLQLIEQNSIEVLADPLNIPQFVEVDINGKAEGESIHAADLSLPQGTELKTLGEATIVIFQEEKKEEVPTAAEEAAEETATEESTEEASE